MYTVSVAPWNITRYDFTLVLPTKGMCALLHHLSRRSFSLRQYCTLIHCVVGVVAWGVQSILQGPGEYQLVTDPSFNSTVQDCYHQIRWNNNEVEIQNSLLGCRYVYNVQLAQGLLLQNNDASLVQNRNLFLLFFFTLILKSTCSALERSWLPASYFVFTTQQHMTQFNIPGLQYFVTNSYSIILSQFDPEANIQSNLERTKWIDTRLEMLELWGVLQSGYVSCATHVMLVE